MEPSESRPALGPLRALLPLGIGLTVLLGVALATLADLTAAAGVTLRQYSPGLADAVQYVQHVNAFVGLSLTYVPLSYSPPGPTHSPALGPHTHHPWAHTLTIPGLPCVRTAGTAPW